jgi:hypothetical protein
VLAQAQPTAHRFRRGATSAVELREIQPDKPRRSNCSPMRALELGDY